MPKMSRGEIEKQSNVLKRHLGELIRQARKDKGLSQSQLGEAVGLTQTDVSRVERGAVRRSPILKCIVGLNIPYFVAESGVGGRIVNELKTLSREDKVSLLRTIIRLKNPPEKTTQIISKYLKEEESSE